MKKGIGTLLCIVALIACCGVMVVTIRADVMKAPLALEDITEGRINDVYAYEQFGDYISVKQLQALAPMNDSTSRFIEIPHGVYGAATMQNPISAINENGDLLFQVEPIDSRILIVNIDGHSTVYRIIH